ncbi:MAG: response regulator transcription factor [Elusimicrobia bacterium]|nr:response regulator transcription factor [Elusimicrobiota bacterium]
MTSKAASILVVDDDPTIVDVLEPALQGAGYSVRTARTADQAFGSLTGGVIDLILLDLELPGISGLELLKIVRRHPAMSKVPVLMMTMHGKVQEKVAGLETGADDYLVKPFAIKELLARVAALLRRSRHGGDPEGAFEVGDIRLDFGSREVAAKGKAIDLTPMEFELLARLMQRKGLVLSYQTLSETLSEGNKIMTSDNLQTHVKNIRRKLGAAGDRIETVHGIGYKLKAD